MSITGKRILIVEDTPSISLFLAANLKSEGANVTIAETTEQALVLYEDSLSSRFPFELLLVDLNLPDSDGTSVLKKVKTAKHQATCIAMSADSSETAKKKALKAGAVQFIEKPFDISALISTLKERLHERDIVNVHSSKHDIQAETWELQQSYTAHLRELSNKLNHTIPYNRLCSLLHQLRGSAALYGYSKLSGFASRCSEQLREIGPTATQNTRKLLKEKIDAVMASAVK
ncbi:response regulator [Kordiimonas laminariae]|uniref:response regulator n=1 Tax=Kordiimonas laminariae TaxID=2917717 RepID=UPI001FF1BA7B|nr:response regulator [Kordiimonas laminariae]MCK0067854.1 response regulator [Kordiimonas laminariae]